MQYAREYTSKSSNETIVLKLINHVRLYKRVFLPFELIGNSGKEQTEAYRIQEKQSQIKQTFYHHNVDKPTQKAFKVWTQFIQWLEKKRITTSFDFDDNAIWNWRLRLDGEVLIITEKKDNRAYLKREGNKYYEVPWDDAYSKGCF